MGFVDESQPCPSPILNTDAGKIRNPEYSMWILQNQLTLNAIVASVSHTIIPFISFAHTSKDAWIILATTYAKPSQGRIMQIKW